MTPPLTTTPADLLREAAEGWEPGPGPFTVPLPVVNKIVNYLVAQPAPPAEALRLLRELLAASAETNRLAEADDSEWLAAAQAEKVIEDEARRYLAATEEGTP